MLHSRDYTRYFERRAFQWYMTSAGRCHILIRSVCTWDVWASCRRSSPVSETDLIRWMKMKILSSIHDQKLIIGAPLCMPQAIKFNCTFFLNGLGYKRAAAKNRWGTNISQSVCFLVWSWLQWDKPFLPSKAFPICLKRTKLPASPI